MANYPPWNEDQWAEALERLTLHAQRKMARLHWRGMRMFTHGNAVCVIEPADLASEALVDAITGHRKWNVETDFLQFLKGIVDSKVYHLVTNVENQRTRRLVPGVEDDNLIDDTLEGGDPKTICAEQEAGERFRKMILAELKGDPLVEGIFECLDAGYEKSAEIAGLLDVDVSVIYNAQKRLRAKADKAQQKYRKVST